MKKFLKGFVVFSAVLFLIAAYLVSLTPVKEPAEFGVTFSAFYAERFGVDWQKMYLAILDELGAKNIRLPAYWSEIESEKGRYDFSRLDFQINEAEKRGTEVILAVGKKLPRWPECHIPDWARNVSQEEQNTALLDYIEATILRYRDSEAVVIWQVENEPFLPFGECPEFSAEFLDEEISLVRSLDLRPVMITDSGELSLWVRAAKRSDVFGSTLYRTIWNPVLGTFTYPIPPYFFRLKRSLTEIFAGERPMIIIELQGESWAKKQTYEISVPEQYVSMNPEAFRGVLKYASRSGFDTFYLWGVEWWYWLKEAEDRPEMWDIARNAIHSVDI